MFGLSAPTVRSPGSTVSRGIAGKPASMRTGPLSGAREKTLQQRAETKQRGTLEYTGTLGIETLTSSASFGSSRISKRNRQGKMG